MDAAAPSRLRAIPRRVASSLSSADVRPVRVFELSRSLGIRRDIFRAVELRPRRVMVLRPFQHVVVRRRLPFVIVWVPIIFAHRMIDKLIPHQNPAKIGVTLEMDSVEVEDFTLLEFGASPDWHQ